MEEEKERSSYDEFLREERRRMEEEEKRKKKEKEKTVNPREIESNRTEKGEGSKEAQSRPEVTPEKSEGVAELNVQKSESSENASKAMESGLLKPLIIPIITIGSPPKPSILIDAFDTEIVVPKEILPQKPVVPIIRIGSSLPSCLIMVKEFDDAVVEPKGVVLSKLNVPIYQKGVFISPKFRIESFDSTVSEGSERVLEKGGMEKLSAGAGLGSVGGGVAPPTAGEEIPDFLETVFGAEGGRIREGGSKIILFRDLRDKGDSYIHFLENVCLRIYREHVGGMPKAKEIREIDELNKWLIEAGLEAADKIFTIHLDDYKAESLDKILDEKHLQERLEETYAQGEGFIIFTTSDDKMFDYIRSLLNRINDNAQRRLNIIEIEAKKLPRKLISLASGMLDLEEYGVPPPNVAIRIGEAPPLTTFDSIFNSIASMFNENSAFNRVLKDIMSEEEGIFSLTTDCGEENDESLLHCRIKAFIVRYLTYLLQLPHTLEEIKRTIQTEQQLRNGVIPDVRVGNRVYEVEMLFGVGEKLDEKIKKTVSKYDNTFEVNEVNVVIDNFGALLHLRDLLGWRKLFSNKRFKVEFYTLNLQDKKLLPLVEFAEEFRRLVGSLTS